MAINVKNIATGEVKRISGIKVVSGAIVPKKNNLGARFIESHRDILTCSEQDGVQVFWPNEGWELIKGSGKPRTPKPAAAEPAAAEPVVEPVVEEVATEQPVAEPVVEAPVQVPETVEPHVVDNVVESYVEDINAGQSVESVKAELMAKYGSLGVDVFEAVCRICGLHAGSVNEAEVEGIFNRLISSRPATQMQQQQITISINNEVHTVEGQVPEDFRAICTTIAKGFPLYMYGEAGTGKSHTAKQVADALGLDFYEAQQVLYAHDMKGYGDAGGNFVPTPFFKAFTQGGLFFLDEVDASQPEALVVLNTAIANRRFDFPVVGNCEAHPNFRVISAGNTKMTGADIEYTARQVQDASTKNRFFFTEVDYSPNIENALAGDGQRDIADFCRDLRQSKKAAQINLCVSYRQIQTLADKDMQEAWGEAKLLRGGVFKELESDEIRILYDGLEGKSNRWAKAMRKLF